MDAQSPVKPLPSTAKRWSIPVRLRYEKSTFHRVFFTVPSSSVSSASSASAASSSPCYPLLLTLTEVDGVVRLAVDVDLHPQILLHNLSTRRLCFGETSVAETSTPSSTAASTSSFTGAEPKECRELVNQLPTLDPLESVFYSFPGFGETYPSLDIDLSKTVRLHFALAVSEGAGGRGNGEIRHEDADSGRLSSMSNPHLSEVNEDVDLGDDDPAFVLG